jgi:hypothetical protein
MTQLESLGGSTGEEEEEDRGKGRRRREKGSI